MVCSGNRCVDRYTNPDAGTRMAIFAPLLHGKAFWMERRGVASVSGLVYTSLYGYGHDLGYRPELFSLATQARVQQIHHGCMLLWLTSYYFIVFYGWPGLHATSTAGTAQNGTVWLLLSRPYLPSADCPPSDRDRQTCHQSALLC